MLCTHTWAKCKFLLHSACGTHLDSLFFLAQVLVSYLNTATVLHICPQFCSFCFLHLAYMLLPTAPPSQTPLVQIMTFPALLLRSSPVPMHHPPGSDMERCCGYVHWGAQAKHTDISGKVSSASPDFWFLLFLGSIYAPQPLAHLPFSLV